MTSINALVTATTANLEEIRQRMAEHPSDHNAVKITDMLRQFDSLRHPHSDVSPVSACRRSTRRGGQGHYAGIVLEYAGQYLCVKVESNWIFPRCTCAETSSAVSSTAITLAATELGVVVDRVDGIIAGGKSHYVFTRLTSEPAIKLGGKYAEYKWLGHHYLLATSTTDDMINTLSGLGSCTGRSTPPLSPKKQLNVNLESPRMSTLSRVPRTTSPSSWRSRRPDPASSAEIDVTVIVTFGTAVLCIDDGDTVKLPRAMASAAVICRAHNRLAWVESVLREHAGIEKVTALPRMILAEGVTAVVVQFDNPPAIDNAPTHTWLSLEEMAERGCRVATTLRWVDGVLTCGAIGE